MHARGLWGAFLHTRGQLWASPSSRCLQTPWFACSAAPPAESAREPPTCQSCVPCVFLPRSATPAIDQAVTVIICGWTGLNTHFIFISFFWEKHNKRFFWHQSTGNSQEWGISIFRFQFWRKSFGLKLTIKGKYKWKKVNRVGGNLNNLLYSYRTHPGIF